MDDAQGSESLTNLLRAWGSADGDAREQVWNQVYDRLHGLAHHVLNGRRSTSGMGTTTVLHEAAIELMNIDIDWNDSRHFFAAAARCMRFVLVDEARRKLSLKRGRGQSSEELPEDLSDPSSHPPDEILAVHQALERLARRDQKQARLVELRYYGGMSYDEAANILGVSRRTAVRMWQTARAWLYAQLAASQPATTS